MSRILGESGGGVSRGPDWCRLVPQKHIWNAELLVEAGNQPFKDSQDASTLQVQSDATKTLTC